MIPRIKCFLSGTLKLGFGYIRTGMLGEHALDDTNSWTAAMSEGDAKVLI
jgi:hypothetical protein